MRRGIDIKKGNLNFSNNQEQSIVFADDLHFSQYVNDTTTTNYLSFKSNYISFEKYGNFGTSGLSIAGSSLGECVISLGSALGAKITAQNTPTSSSGADLLTMTESQFTTYVNVVDQSPSADWINYKGDLSATSGIDSASYIKYRILMGTTIQFIMHLRNSGGSVNSGTFNFASIIPTSVNGNIRGFSTLGMGKNNQTRSVTFSQVANNLTIAAGDSGQDFWWNISLPYGGW